MSYNYKQKKIKRVVINNIELLHLPKIKVIPATFFSADLSMDASDLCELIMHVECDTEGKIAGKVDYQTFVETKQVSDLVKFIEDNIKFDR